MPLEHETVTDLFTDIADAIRAKTGGNTPIVADDFPDAILDIPSGGGTTEAEDNDVILSIMTEHGFIVTQLRSLLSYRLCLQTLPIRG